VELRGPDRPSLTIRPRLGVYFRAGKEQNARDPKRNTVRNKILDTNVPALVTLQRSLFSSNTPSSQRRHKLAFRLIRARSCKVSSVRFAVGWELNSSEALFPFYETKACVNSLIFSADLPPHSRKDPLVSGQHNLSPTPRSHDVTGGKHRLGRMV
jgi:hypothetical protein